MTDRNVPVRHAVVPAAGRGTRFLPITKSVPKEMLPVVDRPSIEYIAREATDAGIDDMLFVTRTGKESIEAYFDADPGLEHELEKAGKDELLALSREYLQLARMHSVRQGHPLGLGHAVLQARQHVGDAPFAVMLPDDLMHPNSTLLKHMIDVRHALGGSVVALLRVTPEQATAYASTSVTPLAIPEGVSLNQGELMRIDRVVEKPPLEEVMSEYAVVGRYVFDPAIFEELTRIEPGRGGEYQLTDGFARLIDRDPADGGGLYGVVVNDRRFDTGDKLGYLEANIALALEDPKLGPQLADFLVHEAGSQIKDRLAKVLGL
ncbi:UTP--glucose-1-phosphate uridylyltransferase [uncultured Actinomyces sp.]|uniref:UTP--glucose-1-phosphate uridylyltransferase n=1 Tax=uncultured Actinomyces sp. TaxID=249061 RepID=UPI00261FD63D|nr:UTP--glucose-1-phosphate uridylyltransferase [uncultured Actinomyces sp.]